MLPLQHVADGIGVDLLHIKGAAVDPSAAARPSMRGTDVDVLVRPDHVRTARPRAATARLAALQHVRVGFAVRPRADLHCTTRGGTSTCTGSSPASASPPTPASIACGATATRSRSRAIGCPVPSIAGPGAAAHPQRRPVGRRRRARPRRRWTDAPRRASRARSRRSSAELDAHVAFAAATGGLERYRDERDYRLWKVVVRGRHAARRSGGRASGRRRRFGDGGAHGRPRAARERRPPRASGWAAHPTRREIVGRVLRAARHAPSARPWRGACDARGGAMSAAPARAAAWPSSRRGASCTRPPCPTDRSSCSTAVRPRSGSSACAGAAVLDRRPRGRGDRRRRSTRCGRRRRVRRASWSSAGLLDVRTSVDDAAARRHLRYWSESHKGRGHGYDEHARADLAQPARRLVGERLALGAHGGRRGRGRLHRCSTRACRTPR